MLSPLLGKKILVTGHTGFKGSWLLAYLHHLGCNVTGLSLPPHTSPNMYSLLKSSCDYMEIIGDITSKSVIESIAEVSPDVIFHLAAQAIVPFSFTNPLDTINANTLGTAHILEYIRCANKPVVSVLITSDKVYENKEWTWGYRETDQLGGKDVYSSSKAAAELLINSYIHSFLSDSNHCLAIARAGNVIGGGDWSQGRLIPDIIRSMFEGDQVNIRNLQSTRPWQHVLEPVRGYISLAESLIQGRNNFQAFNFGPSTLDEISVKGVLDAFDSFGADLSRLSYGSQSSFKEAGLLKLCSDKSAKLLGWRPYLDFTQTIKYTFDWYCQFYENPAYIADFTISQIKSYSTIPN